ncbi:3-hydroxyacyl-CoA dehydrogenase [Burkholderia sp. Bp9004]|nr:MULTISPECIES: 3-hydroxyacyl-CoA dehydrogenase [Burkholderia]KAB0662417.1 3-hydroxyacyl-CoA dehydrogenase [Burkholderia diffusa]MBM2655867.1 3-hydroxyacyl-CoA dehydrogenase [Burkholderia diffusa]RQZ59054.1 3-hydroxyacyl-CoA dehydrogenase [Burkholderia sp. Bp9004]
MKRKLNGRSRLEQSLNSVGVVGAGAMGRGIAQVCAVAGCDVNLFDVNDGAVTRAVSAIRNDLVRSVEHGRIEQRDADAALRRITAATSLTEMDGCDLVVEAIVENLDIKQRLLRDLESIVSPSCILATNTSSLSVTSIASGCVQPSRVAGWHFFNPVTRMRLVEIVQAPRTATEAIDALVELSRRIGHRPIVVPDSPGFVVNHAGRAFVTEGLKLLAEKNAEHSVLDAILRQCAGFRMGPFELLDLTGLDVSVPVMESIHAQYYGDDRYRPVMLARTRLHAGLLGRKAGQGFYSYDGKPVAAHAPAQQAVPVVDVAVWWLTEGAAALPEAVVPLLSQVTRAADLQAADVVLIAPLDTDLSTAIENLRLDPSKVVGIDPVFCGPSGVTLMTCPGTAKLTVDRAQAIFATQSIPAFVISDSPGFVAPRVVACIVNLACEMAQQGIASPEDIDVSVRLGLGYPTGPFEWGDALGTHRVLDILRGLYETFGDQRYRPSPWLVRRARLGLPLTSPERAAA